MTDKEFVLRDNYNRDNDKAENHIDVDEYSTNEVSNESNRGLFSIPIIIAVVAFSALVVLLIVSLSRSQHNSEKEQIMAIEKRLDKLESEFTLLKNLIISKLDKAIKQMENQNHTIVKQKAPTAITPPPEQKEQLDVETKVHKVQAGDSLYKISLQYGLSIELLREYNNLEPNATIFPGQEIKLNP
jgi:LysM repeat protein